MKNSYITVTDQFCGAGGSSQGVRNYSNRIGGGIEVKMALNHWKLAIETHNTNFPDTYHDCTDISACEPRRYMSTDILITSPECTNHSLAKGKKKVKNQLDLFEKMVIDPAAERSRATMWDVPRFAEFHNYNIIIVENVVDARSWVMWDAWLHAMGNLGYNHKCVYLNSMHAHPTPQSRDRMYVVFWKKKNKAPNLDFYPRAYCQKCGKDIESIQSWKDPRKKFGKYKQQYVYRCPHCATQVEPYYHAAFNIIDWSIPGQRIGDRNKALAPNTMKRIEYGLKKHGNSEFIVYLDHSKAGHLVSGIDDAINTQTTAQVAAIVTRGGYNGNSLSISQPEPTMTTQHNFGVVSAPFMVKIDKSTKDYAMTEPAHTVVAGGLHHGIVSPPFIVENYGTSKTKGIDRPIGTMTAGGVNHGILSTESVNAFLSYYYGSDQASSMIETTGTMTTKDRVALVMKPTANIKVEDCTYRMLKAHEVKAAMAFGRDYVVLGNSGDQVKQCGNAVTPPAMEMLVERCVESLM